MKRLAQIIYRRLRGGGLGWWQSGSALDLDFANSLGFNSIDRTKTTPDSILTYTNPSAKMVYGDDGVLGYAPHNLCFQSEAFATSPPWGNTIQGTGVAPTVTADAGNDPNGNPTADRIQFSLAGGTTTTDISRRRQTITVIATPHTFSVYLRSYDGSSTYDMHLTDPSGLTRNIVVTGSWQRFEVSATASASPVTYAVGLRGGQIPANNNTADVLVWGAQLNAGSSALTYIPTTTAAVYSLPIDHNPTTFEPLGVLIEEERKNLLTYSEQFDNADWVKDRVTVTGASINAIVAPDGTMTADKVSDTAAGYNSYRIYNSLTLSAISYTETVYAKAAELSWCYIRIGNGLRAWFDLANGERGAVDSGMTSSIQPVGNGWYRLTATIATATAGAGFGLVGLSPGNGIEGYTPTGGNGIYVWGAQLEAGAFATSYIPTTNNVLGVTRLADQVSILTSAFGYSATAGTVTVNASWLAGSAANANGPNIAALSNGTANEVIAIYNPSGKAGAFISDGGAPQALFSISTIGAGVFTKLALGFEANNVNMAVDGTLGTLDTVATMPTVTTLYVGRNAVGTGNLNGHIKRLTYFPTRRTDADLQVLST